MDNKKLGLELDNTIDEFYGFDSIEDVSDFPFTENFEKKMKKLIRQQKNIFYFMLPKTIRRVACILMIILVISASTMSVNAVKEHIRGFKMDTFVDHIEIFEGDPIVNENAEDFTGDKIKEMLPDGFELVDEVKNEIGVMQEYKNGEQYLLFSIVYEKDGTILLDNEQSEMKTCYDADGNEYIFNMQKEGKQITVLWFDNDSRNLISTNIDKEIVYEMLGIVQ